MEAHQDSLPPAMSTRAQKRLRVGSPVVTEASPSRCFPMSPTSLSPRSPFFDWSPEQIVYRRALDFLADNSDIDITASNSPEFVLPIRSPEYLQWKERVMTPYSKSCKDIFGAACSGTNEDIRPETTTEKRLVEVVTPCSKGKKDFFGPIGLDGAWKELGESSKELGAPSYARQLMPWEDCIRFLTSSAKPRKVPQVALMMPSYTDGTWFISGGDLL